MIDLYFWPTPNGWKVSIMLEECGLPYNAIKTDIGPGDQFKPESIRISPNNKIPAIVDRDIDPVGKIFLHGETWTARADRPIPRGERGKIVEIDDLNMRVERESGPGEETTS